jgi:hypothetical protein
MKISYDVTGYYWKLSCWIFAQDIFYLFEIAMCVSIEFAMPLQMVTGSRTFKNPSTRKGSPNFTVINDP